LNRRWPSPEAASSRTPAHGVAARAPAAGVGAGWGASLRPGPRPSFAAGGGWSLRPVLPGFRSGYLPTTRLGRLWRSGSTLVALAPFSICAIAWKMYVEPCWYLPFRYFDGRVTRGTFAIDGMSHGLTLRTDFISATFGIVGTLLLKIASNLSTAGLVR